MNDILYARLDCELRAKVDTWPRSHIDQLRLLTEDKKLSQWAFGASRCLALPNQSQIIDLNQSFMRKL